MKSRRLVVILLLMIAAFVMGISCDNDRSWHGLTIINNMSYDISLSVNNGEDPTVRIPPGYFIEDKGVFSCECGIGEEEDRTPYTSSRRIIPSGDTTDFKGAVEQEWSYYIVQAKKYIDGKEGDTVFIWKYTWNEFKDIAWTIVIEPGYEEPACGSQPYELTIHNSLPTGVRIDVYYTDNRELYPWETIIMIGPSETGTMLIAVIPTNPKFYVIRAWMTGVDETGLLFSDLRLTVDELEARDWTLVIEQSSEKPTVE